MENVETILEGLLELVRLDMQLRKTGKETAERRQVEDAINSVRAKCPSQSSAILIGRKAEVSWGLLQYVEVSAERAI